MKNIWIFLLVICINSFCKLIYAQPIQNANYRDSVSKKTDTIFICNGNKTLTHPIRIEIDNIKKFDFTEQMPWIAALIIGFISYLIGSGQIKIQKKVMTSNNRQIWINTLRDNVSDYLGKIEHYSVIINSFSNDKDKLKEIVREPIQQEIYSLNTKIVLLLNPLEHNSKELINFLSKYTKSIFGEKDEEISEEELKQKILDITKVILKTEWERVKK